MYSVVDRTVDLLAAAGARVWRDSRGRFAEVPPPPAAEPHLYRDTDYRDTSMRIDFGTNPETTVTLITILPDGSRLAAEDIEPERAVDHWRRAMAELRTISRALIDEHALRARTARITDSHWQEAGGLIPAAPDPANPVFGDRVAIALPAGGTLTRVYNPHDVRWEWRVYAPLPAEDAPTLARLADAAPGSGIRTATAARLDAATTRAMHAAALADATARAVEEATGDERPQWQRDANRPAPLPAAAADLIASSGCTLTIKPGRGDVWQAAVRSDDAPAHVWDTTVALPPDVAGTMPAWAGPDRLWEWLADLFGPVAASRADLGAAGADDTNTNTNTEDTK